MTADDSRETLAVRLVYNAIAAQQWGQGGILAFDREMDRGADDSPAWTGEIQERHRLLQENRSGLTTYKEWREEQFPVEHPPRSIYSTEKWKSISVRIISAETSEQALDIAREFVNESESTT